MATFVTKCISRKMSALLLLLFTTATLIAQVPAGYYDSAEGKTNAELKTSLSNIIKKGTRLSYGSGAGKTWSGFEKTDRHPNGYVWDMYSEIKREFPGNAQVPSGMNIEHSVAKSWWGGSTNDAYKDLYHLNPSDSKANSARSNYPLGINNGSTFNNGAIKVGKNTYSASYSGLCFEPKDEYKGDFARAYMYMFTCYESLNWTGNSTNMLNTSETYPMLWDWAAQMLLEWSRMDPVSDKERNRAEEIYKIQNNRNPFIDYPELAEHLWGNRKGIPFTTNQTEPAITSPSNGLVLTLPETHFTSSSTEIIEVKGVRLTGDLQLTLSGTHASRFTVTPATIMKNDAHEGTYVTITYTPTVQESASATLTIGGGGVPYSIKVTLNATASDNFIALPATAVAQTQFTANWTQASGATGYELHLYEATTSTNTGEETILECDFNELPLGWRTSGYTEIKGGEVKMGSGSQGATLTSNEIDLSCPSTITIKAMQFNNDNGAPISIYVDSKLAGTVITERDYKRYQIDIPASTNTSVIEITTAKGKRAYITDLTITTTADEEVLTPVSGFPKRVGNITTYTINGLNKDTEYRYHIVAVGTSKQTGEITVKTAVSTSTNHTQIDKIKVLAKDGVVKLYNLPTDCSIKIRDINGRELADVISHAQNEQVDVNARGILIVSISHQKTSRTIKTMMR